MSSLRSEIASRNKALEKAEAREMEAIEQHKLTVDYRKRMLDRFASGEEIIEDLAPIKIKATKLESIEEKLARKKSKKYARVKSKVSQDL